MFPCFFPHLAGTSNLLRDDVRCGGEFRTTFRTIPAFVAQWIEQRFPKPQVACSIHAEGAMLVPFVTAGYCRGMSYLLVLALSLAGFALALRCYPHEDGWSGDDSDEPKL